MTLSKIDIDLGGDDRESRPPEQCRRRSRGRVGRRACHSSMACGGNSTTSNQVLRFGLGQSGSSPGEAGAATRMHGHGTGTGAARALSAINMQTFLHISGIREHKQPNCRREYLLGRGKGWAEDLGWGARSVSARRPEHADLPGTASPRHTVGLALPRNGDFHSSLAIFMLSSLPIFMRRRAGPGGGLCRTCCRRRCGCS